MSVSLTSIMSVLASRVKEAAYAPGIPDKRDYGSITNELSPGTLADIFMQRHSTLRNPNRQHIDLRIGTPDTNLFSWAIPKGDMPKPGEKRLAPQTHRHEFGYGSFSGKIGKGYGAGKVEVIHKGKALITKVTPGSISFTLADSKKPTRYSLIDLKKKDGKRNWLLVAKRLPASPEGVGDKPKIKLVEAADLDEAIGKAEDVQQKIDGAHTIIDISEKGIETFGVNPSVTGDPVIHTERVGLAGKQAPDLAGTVLRGEVFGIQDNKAIPFSQTSGILNSAIAKAVTDQHTKNIRMQHALFDVIKYKGKKPPEEYMARKELLKHITGTLEDLGFILPRSAKGDAARRLINNIKRGKDPLTSEGVILKMPGAKTLKYKIRPDTTVYFAGASPGKSGNSRFGGIQYSLTPGGEATGVVGTGYSREDIDDILSNIKQYKGRPMRIAHQGQFGSGLFRAPSFQGWETDKMAQAASNYQVQRGDTLSAIASRHGISVPDLIRLNPAITNPNMLSIGQRIAVPVTRNRTVAPNVAPTPSPRPKASPVYRIPEEYRDYFVNTVKKWEQFDKPRLAAHVVGKQPYVTVGFGFNMDAPASRDVFSKVLPGVSWDDIYSGKAVLSMDQANTLLNNNIDQHYQRLHERMPNLSKYHKELQAEILNMGFTGTGVTGHFGPKTTAHINAGRWSEAADELLRNKMYETAERENLKGLRRRFEHVANTFRQHAQGKLVPKATTELQVTAPIPGITPQTAIQPKSNGPISDIIPPTTQAPKVASMVKRVDTALIPLEVVTKKGKKKIKVELADSEDRRRKGLSKRKTLGVDQGMLFDKCGAFWMKDCEIPLDIAFLAQDGKILDIQNMELSKEADYAKPLYVSKDPRAVYALEMASNWFKDNKVNTGDELCLSF